MDGLQHVEKFVSEKLIFVNEFLDNRSLWEVWVYIITIYVKMLSKR